MNDTILGDDDADRELTRILRGIFAGNSKPGPENSPLKPGPVLIIPPDITRIHSRAGLLAGVVCRELTGISGLAECSGSTGISGQAEKWRLGAIMPALGTHRPLTREESAWMFPACSQDAFVPHRWREDTVELGRLEAPWIEAAFCGKAPPTDWPVEVNRILLEGLPQAAGQKALPFSLIISIGQVVPHEVAGMANHAKNIFIGTGGAEAIHKSHWLGALYGMEELMGRAENPVRSLFDEALRRYGNLLPPILWVLTVVDNRSRLRGIFCGFGRKCFEDAAALSAELNIERISGPDGKGIGKAVVWLDKEEYRSTWLGNKAIYRTRRAMADGGELLILAPGLDRFGEDPALDALIRRWGYRGREAIRRAVEEGGALAENVSAAAHLIHGSSEGRFTIRYCTSENPGAGLSRGLDRAAIEGAGFAWGNLEKAAARYVPEGPCKQKPGWNTAADGERYFFIRSPALGLWV